VPEDAGTVAPDGGGAPDGGIADHSGLADGGGPVDPGFSVYPEVIDALSVAVRTDYGAGDETDANDLDLCLNDLSCFRLDVRDVNDFRRGEIDVYHFYGVGLARAAVDRVQIRSRNGTDRWRPACLEIRFDGEPVYCEDRLGMDFGSGTGQLQDWFDPEGLHQHCATCYPSALTHGPLVGAVGPDSARILVRTDATRRVGLHLVAADLGNAPVVAWRYPGPSRDFTTVFEVQGLAPATRYHYYFEVDGTLAPELHAFTTAPPPGSRGATRFAFGSCTRFDSQPIFAHIRALRPDLFFFLGDNHYANSSDLDSLRWHYRWALERPERAALLAEVPTLATWDDHDYVGNNTDGRAPGKATALRAFVEYWANGSFGTPQAPGTYFKHSRGDVDFFLLDDRTYRGLDSTGLLGAAQTAWLRAELEASRATFKFLLCGSQWTARGSSDSWAAFLPARDALFDFLRDRRIGGVVLLSGDVHRAEFRLISRAAAGGYDLPELTSSPLANTNFSCGTDAELRACFDSGNFFVVVDVDTAASDPALTATIRDAIGQPRSSWTIRRSELGP
jgi:alkaline phosphatase D